jgi:hypothetical protein
MDPLNFLYVNIFSLISLYLKSLREIMSTLIKHVQKEVLENFQFLASWDKLAKLALTPLIYVKGIPLFFFDILPNNENLGLIPPMESEELGPTPLIPIGGVSYKSPDAFRGI